MLKHIAQRSAKLFLLLVFIFFSQSSQAFAAPIDKPLQWPFYDPNSSACTASSGGAPAAVTANIGSVVNKYNLQSVMIQAVGGNVVAEYHSNSPPSTPASTMKLIIADTLLRSGVDLSQTVSVDSDVYYAGGNDLGVNRTSLSDAMKKMLSSSSNVGANVIMKAIGGTNSQRQNVETFTEKAHSYDYSHTNVGGYYDPSNDGKNTSTISDEVVAMNNIFTKNTADYKTAQSALEEAARIIDSEHNHYNVADDANKWAGTSTVAGNVGKFKIAGNDYIIGLYINKPPATEASASIAMKSGSADLAKAVENAAQATTSNPSAGSGGASTPLAGPDLPSDITSAVNKNKSAYMKAAQATNVPWQLLAAVHYRETNFATSGSNLFQILGYSGGDLVSQATDAGNFIQKNAVPGNLSSHRAALKQTGNDPEEIKDTLFSYNGRAQVYAQQAASLGFDPAKQPYEGSPYVMNNFDAKHHNMRIITHDNGGLDGTDTRYGAFAIYAGLGGDTGDSTAAPCTDDATGAVAGNAVETAIKYAWPDYHPAPYCTERENYKQAILTARGKGEYTGGDCDSVHVGIDCGAFITRVMRDSGVDPTYNWGPNNPKQGNTDAQQAYLDEMVSEGKYEKLSVNSTADLKPGDIAINSTHTYMYIGKQPGFHGNSASASFGVWRAPMASHAYGLDGEFTWYRIKTT